MNQVIKFENVSFAYEKELVLDKINFEIFENDFIGIIGPNGGGKSTILKLLLGLVNNKSGNISICGKKQNLYRNNIGYLPQYNTLDAKFPITVTQTVNMGLFKKGSFFPFISKKNKTRVNKILEKLKISNLADKQYGTLSGGQKQRCLMARALVSDPKILILDEPTASVDAHSEKDIYELLMELNKQMTIILVSHDLGFVSSYIKRVFFVNKVLCCHKLEDVTYGHVVNDIYKNKVSMLNHECNY